MHDPTPPSSLFSWRKGQAYFRDLPVVHREVPLDGFSLKLACLSDASQLLDEPDFAQKFIDEDRAPYGIELWPASKILAHEILSGHVGPAAEALEIGCGLGLVSLAATKAGWVVTATDCDELAIEFLQYNATLNEISVHESGLLEWHHPPRDKKYRHIWAADVLYQLIDQEPLLRCLQVMLESGGVAMIADPYRGVADHFPERARKLGFEVHETDHTTQDDTGKEKRGRIFHLSQ